MKHTLKKTKKDLLGQYMTEEADKLLKHFENIVQGRSVIDPFAGYGSLLDWATKHGATDVEGYDVELHRNYKYNDAFDIPVDCSGKLVVTNPPYLSSNRATNKVPFEEWGQSDLYKCYLATLMTSNVEEAIIIQPSNFLFESRSKARQMLFDNYDIVSCEHWREVTFKGVSIAVMVMHIKRRKFSSYGQQGFNCINMTSGAHRFVVLNEEDGYLYGPSELLTGSYTPFQKVDIGMDPPNSNIVVSLLDKGTNGLGVFYNDGEPIYCKPKSFTTYQINTPTLLSKEVQQQVVNEFNAQMKSWREEYDSMFLSNYIDCEQKILSRSYVNKLLTKIIYNGKRQ